MDYQSQLIRVVCHSTAQAEIAAACFAAKRAMYVLQLLRFLGHDIACPIGYLIDCSAVEDLSKKRGATKRTEHFLRWFHHFRWIVLHRYGVVHSVTRTPRCLPTSSPNASTRPSSISAPRASVASL